MMKNETNPADMHDKSTSSLFGVSHQSSSSLSSQTLHLLENTNDNSNIQPAQDQQEIEQHSSKNQFVESVAGFLPKIEPLPWTTFFCLSIWCAIPAAVYILLFTQMGFGENIYFTLSNQLGEYSQMLALTMLLSLFLFYVLDIDEWNSKIGTLLSFLISLILFLGFVILVMLVSNDYPYGIITLFAIFNPLWLLTVKSLFYGSKDTRVFISWLSGPLLLISFTTAFTFIGWTLINPENQWNNVTKVEAAKRTGCVPSYNKYPDCVNGDGSTDPCFYLDNSGTNSELIFPDGCDHMCVNVYSECSNGLILWAGPVLMCLSMFFLSFFCTFLRTDGVNEQDVLNFGKVWIFVLAIIWVSASLAGTSSGVASSLVTLTLASLVASAIFVSVSFNRDERKESRANAVLRIKEKYGDSLDIARGLFVVTCSPFVLVYLLLSMINQFVRRIGINPCSQPASNMDDSLQSSSIFTVRANNHFKRMQSWNWARVLTYGVYWGLGYMTMEVIVSKLTVVFLSWMIEATANFGLAAVTGILFGIGTFMFLLPPVPGVPIYLTYGIVLTAQGYELMGWFYASLFSAAMSVGLKLFTGILQQKVIGENLSHFVKVRQFVGINSTLIKTLRLVVAEKGISLPKVVVLIGGPDWPISVLCGIMRVSLVPIMVGTLPVVFLIYPTCLMGAFLYIASLKLETGNPVYPWAGTGATICAAITAVVQIGSMILAAYYLEQTAEQRKEEVNAIAIDKEVKEVDDKEENLRQCYASATTWNSMPSWPKAILISSLICITSSCYLVQFFPSLCFAEHELTDSVHDNLGGNVANLFMPLGWIAVGLFSISLFFLLSFQSWGNYKAKQLMVLESTLPIVD